MAAQPGLTAQGGPQDNQFFPLQENETIIGRTEACSIQITWDPSVSRRHARICQQFGLYWLEDLGSINGTLLTPLEGNQRKLEKGENALLLEGAVIKLGNHVRLCVTGLSSSQDEALQLLIPRLQQVLVNVYSGMAFLPPEDHAHQLEWLRNFEARLRSAQSEQELLLVASEGGQTLFGTLHMESPAGEDLPPIPEDVPDPAAAKQVKSILNFFFSDIRNRFPKEDDRDA